MCRGGNPVIGPTERLGVGDTGNACAPQRMQWWCHCGIDRQWRESPSSWSAGGAHMSPKSFVFPPPNVHTPLPQFTVYPSCCRQPSNPISVPFFCFLPDRPPLQTSETLIIPFPIINPRCFHTMGPKESCRQQRKHLPLSRQGTNSRMPESVSYIPSVKNTPTHMHIHTESMQTYRWLLPPALPLSSCVPICTITCKKVVTFLRQCHVRKQIKSDIRDLKVSFWRGWNAKSYFVQKQRKKWQKPQLEDTL